MNKRKFLALVLAVLFFCFSFQSVLAVGHEHISPDCLYRGGCRECVICRNIFTLANYLERLESLWLTLLTPLAYLLISLTNAPYRELNLESFSLVDSKVRLDA